MKQGLIDEYKLLAHVCAHTNFGNPQSVRRYHDAVDRMTEIAKEIQNGESAESVEDFAKLLEVVKNRTNIRAAIHLLERIPVEKDLEAKALKVIEEASCENNLEALRYQVWLKEWKEKKRGK